MNIDKLLEALKLIDDQDVEFESTEGQLPQSVWETISGHAKSDEGFSHPTKLVQTGSRQGGLDRVLRLTPSPESAPRFLADTHGPVDPFGFRVLFTVNYRDLKPSW